MILSGVVHVDFGDANGWEVMSAIGTASAALAAGAAAIIAHIISKKEFSEREAQRQRVAEAKRATSDIYISEVCNFFAECALEYEKLMPFMREKSDEENTFGFVNVTEEVLVESGYRKVEFPYRAIDKIEEMLQYHPEHLAKISYIISNIQVSNSRINSKFRDVEIYKCGISIPLYSLIAELAEAYVQTSSLFIWARIEHPEYEEVVVIPSDLGLKIETKEAVQDWMVEETTRKH